MITAIKSNLAGFSTNNKQPQKDLHAKLSLISSDIGDRISFTSSKKPKIDDIKFLSTKDAEIYAKNELGIDADFKDSLILANLAVNALKDVKKAGYKLPQKVISDYEKFKNYKKTTIKGKTLEITAAITYPDNGGIIYLNSKFDWNNVNKRMKKNFTKHLLSSNKPKHIFYHEIGHFLHYVADKNMYNKTNNVEISLKTRKLIKNKVGEYASQDFGEFIAELFAAKFIGRKYSDKIQNLYRIWNGPHPNMKYKNYGSRTINIEVK
ncbi:MAG: hypothetical protein A2287_00910 [Candidatus Melainabacteria bacterium RIFOXYA12_FULL_32_12]|nr:MAG: hypothetical protein A2255_10325 [Candidatus Melainabacteria bacterium RIFOXYA2_FULL_32_9]OGI29735.1 MAG: hypothetical protein A2287_00910 [Candidatus Melainabacteria bacterium RIFOXYA12_FULL_32_12]